HDAFRSSISQSVNSIEKFWAKMSDRLWVRKFTPTRKLPIITVIIPLLALTLWGCSLVGITPTPTLVQQALTIQIKGGEFTINEFIDYEDW
ncbi:hypothetical protein RZS08_02500, partial [Arthrospira platensis SPKY1]|nr:hypothetical protein [Arthrospira platensis SPKY1]